MSQKIRHDQIRTILIEPHVSEKTTLLNQENGQIAFKVRSDSNKKQIKRAVEEMFNVKVSSVKTVSVKGKKKRMGMRSGKTNDWKKAYIKLAEGQNLDIIFGEYNPSGKLPFELPSSWDAVLEQKEDLPYDSKSPLYNYGYGLSYNEL